MKCNLSLDRQLLHDNAFAVCLLEVPPFPPPITDMLEDSYPYAVIAANDDKDAWGYVCLNQDWKNTIGETMLNLGCAINTWYWCEFFDDTFDKEKKDD